MLSAETLRRTLFILTPWLSRIASLIVVVILVGLMPDIAGIDPSQSILRARAGQQHLLTPEALAAVRADLQLDRSASERLIDWVGSAFSGDLGTSWIDGSSVALGLQKTASTSLFLMSSALLMTFVLCGAGLLATLRSWKKGKLGQSYSSLSTVLISLPEYVVASVLILVFSIWLGWLPPYGWQGWQDIWLPSLALALPASGLFSRLLRDSLQRVLNEPWVITWLSANVHSNQIIRFALKRALSSLIPQIAMIVIGLTGGAVAVELIFSIPGIGRMILGAAKAQDLPMLQGGLLVLLLFSIAVSSISLFVQQLILGHSLKSGKLISSHSSFRFTQSRAKRVTAFAIFSFLIAIVVWAVFRDPYTSQFARLASPSWQAPLGADGIGRDLLARIGSGMVETFQAGILATFLSLVTGIIMGFNTRFSQGLIELTKGIPYIIAGLLVAGLTGMNPNSALIAIVLVSWAPLAAHCSSLIVEAKAQPYTHLAPLWGTSKLSIFRFYLLPYVLPPLLRHALLRLPVITLSLTSLSFIGLGAKPPTPEWGLMIAENLPYIERAPLAVMGPIIGLILLGAAINMMFDD
ncbi:putative transport system membrane protein [Vibrio chagasii]|uniref:ABC transporter permease subunit n=1 Tax=Vibrio chagasii TaxID=170679 RepID=UPI001EFE73B7|nr:ABC transporter permease subunit [Vibrio chagasii]MCG9566065.1 ABC transporter permease subunit [Vibrio chagasii]CAH6832077.1 ABC transporter permease subunit [Vibrio chagasii]CAH6840627.1 putative transport system membrane protein [Vibrio chagasii]CAH6845607.1 putative transport system membrane protein [Vibrio chagasii]CAH6845861.1 putative transport system membrane protein [Vibrio chagasii]